MGRAARGTGAFRRIGVALIAVAMLRAPVAEAADAYPKRPILVVIPVAAGGALDIAFRTVRPALSADLGMPMAIVNKAGASGIVGMQSVAIAKPDGYTLAATSTSTLTVVRASAPSVPYTIDAFTPIGNYAFDSTTIVVRADAPWRNLADLRRDAEKNPGKLSYGAAGAGTASAFNMEAIKDAFGLDIVQVPYPGARQAVNGVLSGRLEIGAIPLSSAALLLRDGTLRALATAAAQRPSSFPDIPTLAEAGYARLPLELAIGLYAPAGTPQTVIDILSRALRRTVRSTPVIAALEKAGLAVRYEDGASVRKRLIEEYRDVVDPGRRLRRGR